MVELIRDILDGVALTGVIGITAAIRIAPIVLGLFLASHALRFAVNLDKKTKLDKSEVDKNA